MASPWTQEEIEFLIEYREFSPKDAWLDFSSTFPSAERSYDSIQKKLKQLRNAMDLEPSLPVPQEEDEEENDWTEDWEDPRAEEEIPVRPTRFQSLDVAPIVTRPTAAQRNEQRRAVSEWLAELADVPVPVINNTVRVVQNQSDKSSLVVLLSDLHFGKKTNYFNLAEARRRALSIPLSIRQTLTTEIDEIVIVLAGDSIEGEDIYSNQSAHIECSALNQVQACVEGLWAMMQVFRTTFGVPVRVETCPGNHGRVSHTANELSNWDNVIYYSLFLLASSAPHLYITVNPNYEAFKLFQVKDKVGMAYHHGVKHASTPAMREKVAGWISKKKFDFMVHGHWHEWHIGNWLGKIVIGNGCMCGPDDLAERMGKEEDARQAYFLVTPGKPVHNFSYVEWKTE